MNPERSKSKIGYVIPGFPGQTHIFFWRELAALKAIDVDAQLVSTRPPNVRIQSHTWTEEARKKTRYLFPISITELFGCIVYLTRRGRRLRGDLIEGLAGRSISQVIRNGMLLIIGAKLAQHAEREDWRHIHVHS